MLPDKVYVLRTKQKTNLGFSHNNKSYIVGFPSKACAKRISQNVTPISKIQLNEYKDEVSFGIMTINKHESIEKPCTITQVCMNEFMKYPLNKNIGVVLCLEVLADLQDKFKINTVIIDPVYDIESYRENMVI